MYLPGACGPWAGCRRRSARAPGCSGRPQRWVAQPWRCPARGGLVDFRAGRTISSILSALVRPPGSLERALWLCSCSICRADIAALTAGWGRTSPIGTFPSVTCRLFSELAGAPGRPTTSPCWRGRQCHKPDGSILLRATLEAGETRALGVAAPTASRRRAGPGDHTHAVLLTDRQHSFFSAARISSRMGRLLAHERSRARPLGGPLRLPSAPPGMSEARSPGPCRRDESLSAASVVTGSMSVSRLGRWMLVACRPSVFQPSKAALDL